MDNPEEITVLSLCAGYGGLELGLAHTLENPLRVIAVEIEAYALANLVAKAEEGKLAIEALWPDLRTFPAERFRGCFDFVIAGYPCQGESVAGKQLGDRDPRWLWSHIRHIIEAVQPVWCFFENVANHLNLGYPTVYASLRDMGYKVEAELFTAAECYFGHIRERLFILAHNEQQRLEAYRLKKSCDEIYSSRTPNQDNCIDAIKRFWNTASATNGRSDGVRYRHDRLRLLGNGVVPQQAEKAFRYLLKKLK
ncbi:MAG: DNA cytosine methyltransferase [Planctomycetota bacterium]